MVTEGMDNTRKPPGLSLAFPKASFPGPKHTGFNALVLVIFNSILYFKSLCQKMLAWRILSGFSKSSIEDMM